MSSAHFHGPWGYITRNAGIATILNGQATVVVPHELPEAPTFVTLGAKHAEVADAIWSADATNVTITVPSNVTADREIAWFASILHGTVGGFGES